MLYTLIARLPLQWMIADQPTVTGSIRSDNGAPGLLGATVRLTRPYLSTDLIQEIAAALPNPGSGDFSVTASTPFTRQDSGNLLVSALPDSGARATIDAPITNISASVNVTVTAGALPAYGRALIDAEWVEFTYLAPTMTFLTRGYYRTIAASHLISSILQINTEKATCIPYPEYTVLRKDIL